ncbi:MAG: hypothetical protein QM761_02820 [Pseudoxanthomonas sp.]
MPSPPRLPSATPAQSGLVTAMAWISMAMGGLGVASGLVQAPLLPLLRPEAMLQPLQQAGFELPPALHWMFGHLQMLNLLSLLSSALFAWVSWGLLKRREWARLGFIAFLGLGAVGGCAGAVLFGRVVEWVNRQGGADGGGIDPMLASMQHAMQASLVVSAFLVVVLHGWIAWKLCTREVRAEFRSAG